MAAAFSYPTRSSPIWIDGGVGFFIKRRKMMGYIVAGNELETDADGYLLEADYSEEVVDVIAAAEGIELTPKHWDMLKAVNEFWPEADSKALYDLFPIGPAKQACKVAGLPQPLGKGGY
jgi:tRNA 2-thiouridine synthesizing protein E